MTYKLRFHTGPTAVSGFAKLFRDAGVEVTIEGTEHIHLRSDGATATDAKLEVERKIRAAHPHIFYVFGALSTIGVDNG